jgi:circadian clock protein KaiC
MAKQTPQSARSAGTQARPIAKVSSGVAGLDEILDGGFPQGRTTLATGGPGTGKTMLGVEFLYRSAQAGEAGIFITFEEQADAVRRNGRTLGWDFAALEKAGKLFLLEARVDRHAVLAGSFNIKPILAIIEGQARKMKAKRVVVDAIDVFMRIFKEPGREQEELYGLHDWLVENGFTSLITSKRSQSGSGANGYEFLDYLADCVIALDQRVDGQVSTRRVRVVKYRGSGYAANECPFLITGKGCVVMPVSGVSLEQKVLATRVSSGIEQLDALSGGGYPQGATVLISGATGTGKTTLACTFVRAACTRGEKVLYLSFEESQAALISNMLSPGVDLRPAVKTGNLQFLTLMPESASVEQHLLRVLQILEEFGPDHVIVDAISACHRLGSERAAFDYLLRLVHACKQRGITLIMINQLQGNDTTADLSGVGISSLVDAIVTLRYMELRGGVIRALRVYKNRGAKHSNGRHPFRITDDGIDIETVPGQGEPGEMPPGRVADRPVERESSG